MHVAHVISSLDFGGAQKIVVGLAEHWAAEGGAASVIAVAGGTAPVYEARLAACGIPIRSLAFRGRLQLRNLASLWRARRRLAVALDELAPDVVHVHLFLPKLLLLRGRRDWPVVATWHSFTPWWTGHGMRMAVQRWVDRAFARRVCRWNVCVSQAIQDALVTHVGAPSRRCSVIHNFADEPPAHAQNRTHEPNDGPPTVLVVSRIQFTEKGLDTAVRVFAAVRQALPRARLRVVGDGPDLPRLRALVAQQGLAAAVEFRGYRDDVYAEMQQAAVMLMPSRWEGLSVAAIEAGLAGLPVVASAIPGFDEVVEHGVTGLLHPPDDAAGMAASVVALVRDPGRRARMAQAARDAMQRRFTRARAATAYREVYRCVLAE